MRVNLWKGAALALRVFVRFSVLCRETSRAFGMEITTAVVAKALKKTKTEREHEKALARDETCEPHKNTLETFVLNV